MTGYTSPDTDKLAWEAGCRGTGTQVTRHRLRPAPKLTCVHPQHLDTVAWQVHPPMSHLPAGPGPCPPCPGTLWPCPAAGHGTRGTKKAN